MIQTYRASRELKMGAGYRYPGDLVPEAATWFRVESFVHTGYLREVDVTEKAYVDAVQSYCPDMAEELAPLAQISLTKLTGEEEPDMTDSDATRTYLGSDAIEDEAAKRRFERDREAYDTPPAQRPAAFGSQGTPAHLDETTPDDTHSDGS